VSNLPAFADVFAAVAAAMREMDVRWYLFGAQAATVWGRPRLTADVDITAQIPPDRIDSFTATMRGHNFRLRFEDHEFVMTTRVLPFVHATTAIPVDVVLAGSGIEEEFLARAINVDIEGTVVPVISPEDLIVTKILAGRPKDVEDVRGILAERAESLDLDRIRDSLTLLETALSQSDLLVVFEKEIRKRS
jgi:hypothetical protein